MRSLLSVITFVLLAIPVLSASAASFDCAKAKRPLEKLICSNAELDATDTHLGEIYTQINASFPLKNFVRTTQQVFLAGYPSCLVDGNSGRPATTTDAVRNCIAMAQERIVELKSLAQANVYSDANGKFSPENMAILTFTRKGRNMIGFWGNWMPDGFRPKPFPDGFLCVIESELKPVKGGFKTDETSDAVFSISDNFIRISEVISCTPRNGIADGDYRRVL